MEYLLAERIAIEKGSAAHLDAGFARGCSGYPLSEHL
jgi:hypothetical protein